MARLKPIVVALVLALGCVSPVRAQIVLCAPPAEPILRAELYFGRNIGGRLGVSERQWTRFVARELTPRFPDGATMLDARDQWRDPARHALVREPTKLVIILAPDEPGTHRHLAEVIAAYKKRFSQKSVALVTNTVCAAF